jgi:hypothetical protein
MWIWLGDFAYVDKELNIGMQEPEFLDKIKHLSLLRLIPFNSLILGTPKRWVPLENRQHLMNLTYTNPCKAVEFDFSFSLQEVERKLPCHWSLGRSWLWPQRWRLQEPNEGRAKINVPWLLRWTQRKPEESPVSRSSCSVYFREAMVSSQNNPFGCTLRKK